MKFPEDLLTFELQPEKEAIAVRSNKIEDSRIRLHSLWMEFEQLARENRFGEINDSCLLQRIDEARDDYFHVRTKRTPQERSLVVLRSHRFHLPPRYISGTRSNRPTDLLYSLD